MNDPAAEEYCPIVEPHVHEEEGSLTTPQTLILSAALYIREVLWKLKGRIKEP